MTRFLAGLSLFTILALFAFAPSQSTAQAVDPTGGAGVKAYGAYHGSSIEHISLETSKLIANIPLISYPQRGGKLRVEFALHWYNPSYTYTHVCSPYLNPPCLDGFGSANQPSLFSSLEGLPYVTGIELDNNPQYQNNTIWDSDGGGHQSAPIDSAGQGPVYRSIDATGYWLNATTNTIIDANGIRYINEANGQNLHAPTIAEDSNGNEMTINVGSSVVDTLNRTIPYPLSSTNPTTTNYTGCKGPLPTQSATLWNVPDQNGGTVTLKFCFASVHIQINALQSPCPAQTQCSEPNSNVIDVQSIVLPNGTAWEFEYNGGTNPNDSTVNAGLLSKITLPAGGTVSYAWNTPPEHSSYPTYNPVVLSRTLNANDGSGAKIWTYAGGIITDPLGNNEVHTLTSLSPCFTPGTYYDTRVQYYQGAISPANLLKTVATTYSYSPNPYGPICTISGGGTGSGSVVNVVPLSTTTTWPNGQVSQETKSYDSGFTYYPELSESANTAVYGKIISDTYYDYGPSAPGPVLKQVNNTWLALTNSNYLSGNLLNLLAAQQTVNSLNAQQAYTSNTYDSLSLLSSGVTTQFTTAPNGSYRGNLTLSSRWLNTSNSNLTTTNTYYDAGMLGKTQDPVGNVTQLFYSTAYAGGYVSSVQDALTNTTTFTYDYNTGEMLTRVDANKQPTSYSYDSMRRVIRVNYPDGGQTSYQYAETADPFTVTTTEVITSSVNKTTVESVDGFGRLIEAQLTSDPQGPVFVYTSYDGDGRLYTVTNPYRSTGDSTYGVTSHAYDALGRITTVTEPDTSQLLTSYTGNCTTVTDETGKKRTSCVDGLGRLTEVLEDPSGVNYETDYAYDPLGDLLSINQKGGSTNSSNWRTRTFTYDSVSRIVCAANPEVQAATCPTSATGTFPIGATTYTYDLNGNLAMRVVPKADQTGTLQTTHNYTYDALNRLVQESHLDPSAGTDKYAYDGTALTGCSGPIPPSITSPTNLIGRRTAMCAGLSASSWSYDSKGRPLFEATTNKGTAAKTYTTGYTYYSDGSLKTLTYPSSDTLTYTVGGAGLVTQLSDSFNNYVGYAGSPATYAPQGSLAGMVNGSTSSFAGIVTSNTYNDRLQPILLSASIASHPIFSLCYDFHLAVAVSNSSCNFPSYTTGNNGNVFQILSNVDSTRSTAYAYDALNRISQSNTINTTSSNCWGEAYTIDAWGNLTNRAAASGMAGNCYTESLKATATTQNQLGGIGLIYDVAGNVTKDNLGNTITHDAEDRIATIAGFTYSYDADGMRMEKTSGSSGTMYWRGVWGTLVETDLTGSINEEYVYFNGLRIARVDRPSGTVHYYFSNHLGSHTVVTSATGSCEQDIDYYPYGGEQHEYCATPVAQNYKFTGKERDSESGLDNFGARFEASSLGRFMTPDWAARPISVPYATFGDPQTLNLYSYVENAPLNRIDADGHEQHQAGDVEAACANGAANCTMSANNQQFTGQAQNTQVKIRVPGTTITVTATIGMSDSERALFSLALGHHGLPRALFRFLPRGAARTWLEREFVTGPLQGKHYYDAAHRAYNEAVQDLLKLRTEEGEADVAKEVMRAGQRILDSDNPAIKGFLDNMTTADGMTGREALGRALAGDGEAFGEFAAGAVGEVVMGAAEAP